MTNKVKADLHKHWMMQLFIGIGEKLEINVDDQQITCRAIVVNVNTIHMFNTGNLIHFTMLINPTTQLGRSMRRYFLKDKPFYIFREDIAVELQMELLNLIRTGKNNYYSKFIKSIDSYFTTNTFIRYDIRIERLLKTIEDCDCERMLHQVKYIAKTMHISESRLSHLFKYETGIPLKSYIVLHKLQRVYENIFNGQIITDAAIKSGFDSSAHFASTNKKMTGMSARDIIKDSRFLKVII